MKTAIVSGATGFIGIHLTEELLQSGFDVVALCRTGSPHISRLPQKAQIVECRMDEYSNLPEMLAGCKADVFYHLAWEGASGPLRADEALQINNAEYSLAAMYAASRLGCARFIGIGTVYEHFRESILASGISRPADPYILSKCFTRDMLRQTALKLSLPFVWCTFFQPIGRYMKPEQLMAYAILSLMRGESPSFGPAQQPVDIIAVEDLARALVLAAQAALKQPHYYIGSGTPRRLADYLLETREILGAKPPIGIGLRPDDGFRFDEVWYNDSNFVRDTGFSPKVSFSEAVLRVRDYFQGA